MTTSGAPLTYTENAPATAVDPTLTVTDADNVNLNAATVSISANYVLGEDVLSFVNQLGITGTFDAPSGVLTLVGVASKANYQTALRSVKYVNTSDSPSTATRSVSFVVSDGNDPGAAAVRTINVGAANDNPVNVVPGLQSFPKNTSRIFSAANGNGLSFSDVDDNGALEQITLSSAGGTIALGTLAELSGSGNGTGSLTYTGTVAALNAALDGLTFTPTPNFTGSTSLILTTNDLGNTGSGGAKTHMSSIPLQVVNPAPLLISEILHNPPVSTSTSQYVELRSTAGGNYVIPSGVYLVGIEGHAAFNTGEVHDIFDLSGMTTGANGHLAILPSSNLYTLPINVTDPTGNVEQQGPISPGFGNNAAGLPSTVGHSADGQFASIERANSVTFFLVQAPTAPLPGDDIDANDDGFTDGGVFNNWTILDSVGFGNYLKQSPDYVYGAINFIDPTGEHCCQYRTDRLDELHPGVDWTHRPDNRLGRQRLGRRQAPRFVAELGNRLDQIVPTGVRRSAAGSHCRSQFRRNPGQASGRPQRCIGRTRFGSLVPPRRRSDRDRQRDFDVDGSR